MISIATTRSGSSCMWTKRRDTENTRVQYKSIHRLTSARSVGLVQKPGSNDQIWLIIALYVLYSTTRPFFSYSSPVNNNEHNNFNNSIEDNNVPTTAAYCDHWPTNNTNRILHITFTMHVLDIFNSRPDKLYFISKQEYMSPRLQIQYEALPAISRLHSFSALTESPSSKLFGYLLMHLLGIWIT